MVSGIVFAQKATPDLSQFLKCAVKCETSMLG